MCPNKTNKFEGLLIFQLIEGLSHCTLYIVHYTSQVVRWSYKKEIRLYLILFSTLHFWDGLIESGWANFWHSHLFSDFMPEKIQQLPLQLIPLEKFYTMVAFFTSLDILKMFESLALFVNSPNHNSNHFKPICCRGTMICEMQKLSFLSILGASAAFINLHFGSAQTESRSESVRTFLHNNWKLYSFAKFEPLIMFHLELWTGGEE